MSAWLKVEKGEQPEILCGLEGEVLALTDHSTSILGKKAFAGVIEYIYAHGCNNHVIWSEKANEAYDSYPEANKI